MAQVVNQSIGFIQNTDPEFAGRMDTAAFRLSPPLVDSAGKVTEMVFDRYGAYLKQAGQERGATFKIHYLVTKEPEKWEAQLVTLGNESKLVYKYPGQWEAEIKLGGKYGLTDASSSYNTYLALGGVLAAVVLAFFAGRYTTS